jgi:uncharacterized Zn-binding protein involved in type VI secretion
MPPAARVSDMHVCPMVTPGVPPIPHVGGPILPPGVPTVMIGFLPAATVTNMATCVGPPDVIVKGSTGVFINFLPAARMGDTCAHGGTIVLGEPTVMIGEIGSPSPGAGGAGAVMAGLVAGGAFTPKAGQSQTALLSTAGTQGTVAAQTAATYTPPTGPTAGWNTVPAPQTLSTPVTSEAVLVTEPDKATTLLGRWDPDMEAVKNELNPPEGTDVDCAPNKFNFLNVPPAIANSMPPAEFFEKYNKPWLAAAIQRGDKILLCTTPLPGLKDPKMYNPMTKEQTTFGREIEYLAQNGYYYDPITKTMTKPKPHP